MYQTTRPFRSEYVPLRTLNYHVSRWDGADSAPDKTPLILLHGWMDVGASFQFIVDVLSEAFVAGRPIWAPDWRGFGRTQPTTRTDHYVFADYLADLDQLLDHYAPGQPVDVVGHSMGGNIAMLYAGARPERVRRLINLEGFGLPATQPDEAPARYAQWMDELKKFERGEMNLKPYDSALGVAQRLMKTNPRLPLDKALWLAQHWAERRPSTATRIHEVEDMTALDALKVGLVQCLPWCRAPAAVAPPSSEACCWGCRARPPRIFRSFWPFPR